MTTPQSRPATEFAEVWKFRFGATVRTDDGELGSVFAVVIDPASRVVGYVGVQFGFLPRVRSYVPLSDVTDANAAGIVLSLPRAEIEQKYKTSPAGAQLSERTQFVLGGKRLGTLRQLTINRETSVLRHLVVDRGLAGEVVIASTDIQTIEGTQAVINPDRPGGQPLNPFRPDSELYDAVFHAIDDYPRLRVDEPGIAIHVIDGVIWFKGYVSSELNRDIITDLLVGIHGISEVHNELIADPDLAANVSTALAQDPRTAQERIGVYPMLGNVRLRGIVRTAAARAAAGEIAARVPGVGKVTNDLGVNPTANEIPTLAAVTNSPDTIPGGD